MFTFPKETFERWVNRLPNILTCKISCNIGVCEKHCPDGYARLKKWSCRPKDPPSLFGTEETCFRMTSETASDRNLTGCHVSAYERAQLDEIRFEEDEKDADKINSWHDLVPYCRNLKYATQVCDNYIRIIKTTRENNPRFFFNNQR